jgi:hypothetical protein
MERQPGGSPLDITITPISPVRPIGAKGRKREATPDMTWREVLLENLQDGIHVPAIQMKEPDDPVAELGEEVAFEEPPPTRSGITIETKAEFDNIIAEIRKMADEPEKLVLSHLGVFIDPAPPGRLLNSQG